MKTKEEIRDNFLAAWNRGDFSHMKDGYAKNYRSFDTSGMPSGDTVEGIKQTIETYRTAFPNLNMRVTHVIRDADQVCVRWQCKGRNTGELMGMKPSNKQIEVSGTSIYRYENDKVVEEYTNWDALSFLQQMGTVPEMKRPAKV